MMSTLVFVMGPTCSGKSTFLQYAKDTSPNEVGLVEVGKMFRAKYPPEYFKGSAAPNHTAVEAWNMCINAVEEHLDAQKEIILIDGQPRSIDQVEKVNLTWNECQTEKRFVLITAPMTMRKERVLVRFADHQKAEAELALARSTNDMILYYDVLAELLASGQEIDVVKSTVPENEWMPRTLAALLEGIPL